MKRIIVLLVLLNLSLNVWGSDLEKFRAKAEEYVYIYAKFNPTWASYVGIHRYDNLFDDHTSKTFAQIYAKAEEVSEFLEMCDTSGWPIDDQIDYILLKSKSDEAIYFIKHDSTEKTDPSLFTTGIYNGLSCLVYQHYGEYKQYINPILARMRAIPQYLEESKTIINRPYLFNIAFSAYTSRDLLDLIDGVSEILIDSFPERTGEISTIKDKSKIAIRDYWKYYADASDTASHVFGMGKTNFEYMINTTYLLNIDSDSLIKMMEKVFHDANSRAKYYKHLLPPAVEDNVHHDMDLFPMASDTGQTEAFCKAKLESIIQFLDEKDILDVPGDINKCYIKKTSDKFDDLTNKDLYIKQGVLDSNQTVLYYSKWDYLLDDDTVNTEIRKAQRKFNDVLIPFLIPGEFLRFQMAKRCNSLIRKTWDDDIAVNGWKFYTREILIQNGWSKDSIQSYYDFYNDLRNCAFDAILDIKTNTGTLSIDSFDNYAKNWLGEDTTDIKCGSSLSIKYARHNLSFVLGRYLYWDLQQKARAKEGANFSLKDFHYKIISEGIIPVSLVAKKYGWE
jgi:hypothetical protein